MKFWQFIISVIVIIIIHLILKIITNETSEDKYHRDVHKDVDDLGDSPIIKFKFNNEEDYLKIKDNIHTSGFIDKHYQSIEKFKPNFIYCARLLKSKGILTFIEIAKLLPDYKFLVFGDIDPSSKDSLTLAQVNMLSKSSKNN